MRSVEKHLMKFIRTFTVPAKHDCMLCLQNEKETLKERPWTDVKKLREKQNHCTEEADKHLNTYLFNLPCLWSEHLKVKLNNVPLSIKKISCEMFKIRYREKKDGTKRGIHFHGTKLHYIDVTFSDRILFWKWLCTFMDLFVSFTIDSHQLKKTVV